MLKKDKVHKKTLKMPRSNIFTAYWASLIFLIFEKTTIKIPSGNEPGTLKETNNSPAELFFSTSCIYNEFCLYNQQVLVKLPFEVG